MPALRSEAADWIATGAPFLRTYFVDETTNAPFREQIGEEIERLALLSPDTYAQAVIVNPYPHGLFAVWAWLLVLCRSERKRRGGR